MSSSFLLSVIIVSYNTSDFTQQTVQSVFTGIANSQLLREHTEVIVVDNHSTDQTVPRLKSTWSQWQLEFTLPASRLQIIEETENLGFGAANNVGIQKAQGKYLLFLNSDTVVVKNALEQLVSAFEDHPINERTAELASYHGQLDKLGVLSATLLNPDHTLQPQGGSFPTLFSLMTTLFFLDDIPLIGHWLPAVQHTGRSKQSQLHSSSAQLRQQDWVGGTAMMVRASMLQEIDNFDQNIFMYGEDIELCLRAKNHHWDVAVDPRAEIIHYGSVSSSSANAIIGEFKGYIYIWAKHRPGWQMPILKRMLKTSAYLKQWIFGTILRRPEKAEPYTRLVRNVLR